MDSKLRWLAAGVGALILFIPSLVTIGATSGRGGKKLPQYLSETGIFSDIATLVPSPGMIAYDINVPQWADGAITRRWLVLPGDGSSIDPATDRIVVKPGVPWAFPAGSVFVQHFEWAPDPRRRSAARRLETRLLVRDRDAGVYGFSYRWNADGSDARLVERGESETLNRQRPDGSAAAQIYDYLAPDECLVCHNQSAGGVLGVNYGQIDRPIRYGQNSSAENQLVAWNRAAMLSKALDEPKALDAWNLLKLPRWMPFPFWVISGAGRLTPADADSGTLEDRARSYLEANCASCHSPGIVNADWDARLSTPLSVARLVGAPARIPMFEARNIIEPGSPERSLLYLRLSSAEPGMRMPPIGRNTVDEAGSDLLFRWVRSLPIQVAH